LLITGPIRGDFPSLKLGRMVRYGSTIERDLLYFLEYWQTVTWYREQPMTIEHTMPDGSLHRYTPDYEIHEGTIKTLVECKPEPRLESEQAQQQRQIGQLWAEANGYHFVTFTDTELRSGHQLANLRLFWRYARREDRRLHHQVVEQVTGGVACSTDALCQQLGEPLQIVFPAVCNLLFHQRLQVDLSLPFTTAVPLRVAKG
jgi:hypothetical protein